MTDILLSGCNGKMGRVITACAAERDDCQIVAGIDLNTQQTAGYPVFDCPEHVDVKADVIIDFSHPSVVSPCSSMQKPTKSLRLSPRPACQRIRLPI